MMEIKASPGGEDETKLIVNANANIIYDVVVQALDACRGKRRSRVPIPSQSGQAHRGLRGLRRRLLSAGIN